MEGYARMMRRGALLSGVALATLAAGGALPVRAADALTDGDIADAYLYLLGRLLVLRQEILDFRDEGFKWNEIIYREPGGVAWANPNLDVAYSEAWVAVDENTPAVLDVPEIKGGRYYTWQMLNGWGETTVNINERSFKDHPFGKFAFVLQGSSPEIPAGAVKVEVPNKKSRVLSRVELGSDLEEAKRLQKQFTLTAPGSVTIDPPVAIALFTNDKLPGAEAFDQASAILASEADINPGMAPLQERVAAVEALVKSGDAGRARVQKVIETVAWPALKAKLQNIGVLRNGWGRPARSATMARTICRARRST